MTKNQLSLIRSASTDHADGGTKWRKRMERWLKEKDEQLPNFFRWVRPRPYDKTTWLEADFKLPKKYKSAFAKEWAAVLQK